MNTAGVNYFINQITDVMFLLINDKPRGLNHEGAGYG